MLFRRLRFALLSLSSAGLLVGQQVFIQVPLVQAQTWTEYYDSLSKNPLPVDGVNSKLMFDGAWSAAGYQCLLSARAISSYWPEPYPETVGITVENGVLKAIAGYGSNCMPKGKQTFTASLVSLPTINNQSSFPVTFITGTGQNPTSVSVEATLRVIDADYFVIRVPSFRYLNSNVDEKPLYIEFRRKSQKSLQESPMQESPMQESPIARRLREEYPGWKDGLDPCPCTRAEAAADSRFKDATYPLTKHYHPGAESEYRSIFDEQDPSKSRVKPYASTIPGAPSLMPGQQCTYDVAGNLITGGAGAGTPDAYSPEVTDYGDGLLNENSHTFWDVNPFDADGMTSQEYHQTWTPNNGNACPSLVYEAF